jgi:hypothetical protein
MEKKHEIYGGLNGRRRLSRRLRGNSQSFKSEEAAEIVADWIRQTELACAMYLQINDLIRCGEKIRTLDQGV